MLNTIRTYEVDWILVWQPSRISRNSEDMNAFISLLELEKNRKIRKGVITEDRIYSVEKKEDIISLEQYLLNAKQENERRSVRAKKNQDYLKQEESVYTHRFPFGYECLGKQLVRLMPEEAKLVRLAFDWRLRGCQWKDISEEFRKNGYERSGDTIKKMLDNPLYYGEFEYEGKMYPVKNEGYQPIISKPQFDEVFAYNEKNANKHGKSNPLLNTTENKFLDRMVFDTA